MLLNITFMKCYLRSCSGDDSPQVSPWPLQHQESSSPEAIQDTFNSTYSHTTENVLFQKDKIIFYIHGI
jgi:hypothetical protein